MANGLRVLVCVLLLTSLSQPAAALGREVSYGEARDQFGSLQELQRCGDWQIGERNGEFRLLRFSLYGQDLLFVDRIEINASGTAFQVVEGFGFVEFNNDHAEQSLSDLHCSSDGKATLDLSGTAVSGHDDQVLHFRVEVDAASGTYRYSATPDE